MFKTQALIVSVGKSTTQLSNWQKEKKNMQLKQAFQNTHSSFASLNCLRPLLKSQSYNFLVENVTHFILLLRESWVSRRHLANLASICPVVPRMHA